MRAPGPVGGRCACRCCAADGIAQGIGRVLKRHGVYDQPRAPRSAAKRYECAEAGALLHIDALRVAKIDRSGHWATGDRRQRDRSRKRDTVVIGVIDHTRLVYAELHSSENANTVCATLARAIPWFTEQGCGPVQAVMSDG